MIEFTDDMREYQNSQLSTKYDIVSADFGDGTIVQSTSSGRDAAGGITFTPNTDTNGTNYELFIGEQLTAQATRIVQLYVDQTAAQGTLGGRLLTFVDAPEDVFGSTVQLAMNIMSDNTLLFTRSTAANTGIVLRGIDQGVDSQMTSLGTGPAVDSQTYLEVQVIHHPTNGSITVWQNNVLFLTLSNKNTASSGLNQSTTVLWGGYGVTGDGDDVIHHEDLAATISDVMVINGSTNPSDANDPITRIGDHKPQLSLPTADSNYTEYTPDPSTDHFANVDEIPPDEGTSQNSASDTGLRDNFVMQDGTGTGTNQVYLAYNGFVKSDTPTECGVSAQPANFEALVWMDQTVPGTCETGTNDASPCTLSNAETRRGQSVCTISQDGESVTFKPNVNPTGDGFDGFWVGLSPLDAPPVVWNRAADLPGEFMQLSLDGNGQNMAVSPGRAEYVLPFYQPWAGYCYSTTPADGLETSGDYIQFKVSGDGASFDVGFIDHTYNLVTDPYSPVAAAFHFREDVVNTPFFFCGENFTYTSESTFSYAADDEFKILRQDPDILLYQNGVLRETITPGVMPASLYPYMLAGRWGFRSSSYSIPPAIYDAVQQVGTSTCIVTSFRYNCVQGYDDLNYDSEFGQWGIGFTDFTGGNTAQIIDGAPHVGVDFFPTFDYDGNVELTFALIAGNVVLQIRNALSVNSDGSPNFVTIDANNADFTYSRPYSQTTDFSWQPNVPLVDQWYRTGLPVWPLEYLQYDFINDSTHAMTANAPLRLMVMVSGDSDYALPYKAGINTTSFTFVATSNPSTFTGFMRQSSADRSGTTTQAPTDAYAYRQSFLSTAPDTELITLTKFNINTHGYTDPAE